MKRFIPYIILFSTILCAILLVLAAIPIRADSYSWGSVTIMQFGRICFTGEPGDFCADRGNGMYRVRYGIPPDQREIVIDPDGTAKQHRYVPTPTPNP